MIELRTELVALKRSNLDGSNWREWGAEEVFLFIMGSVEDDSLKEYEETIRAEVFDAGHDGETLEDITRAEIKEMGIRKVKPARAVLRAIQELVRGANQGRKQPQPGAIEGAEAEAAPTAYHIK